MCIRNPSASAHATAALINTNNLTDEKHQPLLSVLTKHTTPPAAHAGLKQEMADITGLTAQKTPLQRCYYLIRLAGVK